MNTTTDSWIAEFFSSIDHMDAEAFAGHFSSSGHFRFANHPPLEGPGAIAAGAQGIFGLLTGIRHEVLKSWQAAGDILVEGVVHYHRAADDRQMAYPFLSVFEFEQGPTSPVKSYRVFVDSHELFLPPVD
ncbi:MAG: nuclear transport factor 2 family protein [Wenzhouxiangella sp.]|jgi:hypothetical protein|nr:nuclear transport factor 2 family protein [Wenzhouxiangella sp.]